MSRKNDTHCSADFALAHEAIEYARSIIKQSYTLPGLTYEEALPISEKFQKMLHREYSYSESLKDLYIIPNNHVIRNIKRTTRSVKISSVGNCSEYSYLVMNYLRKRNIENFAKLHSPLYDGNHSFIVMNMGPLSDPAKPKTWGDNAIIVDAWANECYGVTDIYKKLKLLKIDYCQQYPNTLFPYTDKNKLGSSHKVSNGNNANYKKSLVQEAIDKIELIQSVLARYNIIVSFLADDLHKQANNLLLQPALTNFDVERMLNKLIKKMLTLVDEKIPDPELGIAQLELATSVIHYMKQHSSIASYKEFVFDIQNTEMGKHSSAIRKLQ